MDIGEIIASIEAIAPLRNAAPWDKCGIQVASHRQNVQTLAVCLDPTPSSIDAALKAGADFILSHHPLSLAPTLPARLDDFHEVLRLLLGADVPLYAAHTSLDSNPKGPAGWLAEELQLKNTEVLEVLSDDDNCVAGFGLVGNLGTSMAFSEIALRLQQFFSLDTATLSGNVPATVRRIAYCTGSGGGLCEHAEDAGADLYITGDIKYHTALASRIAILDVGHHALEEEMMRRMSVAMQQKHAGIKVVFIPSSSPFRRVEV